jgi:tRNA(fMet)-specific endonuclease VapC
MIAATALVHEAVVGTHNMREFSRVDGLTIEDWEEA